MRIPPPTHNRDPHGHILPEGIFAGGHGQKEVGRQQQLNDPVHGWLLFLGVGVSRQLTSSVVWSLVDLPAEN
jgi:hypothetical protein